MTDQLIAGRYRVLSPPLQGGQATVVEAFDERHDRKVALKISTIDDESGAALLAETRVLLDLRAHPGLPIVRDDDFLGDQYIVVMDWVEGTDLGQLLRQSGTPGLSRSSVVDYIVQAAAALDHLHSHEPPVIHGDVKPSNLILTPEGRIVLVDFGIARTGPGGHTLGSRGFAAPEVAAGGPVKPAADVYGLAATAVTLLTGHSPGQAGLDLAELHLDDVGPMARALRRALSTNPTKRPASAGELAEGLRAGHGAPPTGVVTFMATENVGTGERWDDDPEAMDQMSQRLDDLVFEVVDSRDGMLVTSSAYGERTLSLFRQPSSAVATAFALHEAILDEPWPGGIVPQLRIGLHSGESGLHDGSYSATMLNRVGRLRSLAPPAGPYCRLQPRS